MKTCSCCDMRQREREFRESMTLLTLTSPFWARMDKNTLKLDSTSHLIRQMKEMYMKP